MKDLRQREERRDNKDAQDALDRRFKDLTIQIHSLMVALQYTKENMQFQLSEQVLSDLENLLAEHKGVIRSGYAEKEAIDKTQSDYKHIQQSILLFLRQSCFLCTDPILLLIKRASIIPITNICVPMSIRIIGVKAVI